MNDSIKKMTLGDIVIKFPEAADIFQAYEIDFCCGGHRSLNEVLNELGPYQKEAAAKLELLLNNPFEQGKETQETEKKTSIELMDHITNTHHKYLYDELPRLEEYLKKIENVHGARHSELEIVYDSFLNLKNELFDHLAKEEKFIFPAIKDYEQARNGADRTKLADLIAELEEEHDTAGSLLKKLRSITRGYQVPSDGCATYQLTYKKLIELESDLFRHIHLENNILFQRYAA